MSDLLTVKEAAAMLGVGQCRVRGLNEKFYRPTAKSGKLEEVKVGHRIYITRKSVEARLSYIEQREARLALIDREYEEKKRENRERIERTKERLKMYRQRLLDEIKSAQDGITLIEAARNVGLDSSHAFNVLKYLREQGLVFENGRRQTGFGGSAIVWMARNE